MCEMQEAAFSYRSLYLLCTRSQDMALTLMRSAEDMGDMTRARRLADEVCELGVEARRWYGKWETAGGFILAPISRHLPVHRVTLDSPGTLDMTNVIMFPTMKERNHAC